MKSYDCVLYVYGVGPGLVMMLQYNVSSYSSVSGYHFWRSLFPMMDHMYEI